MQLATKIIVVTGAGGGIGRELVWQLLRKGASVAGVDISATGLAETQAGAGVGEERFRGFALDITDQAQVAALPAEVVAYFGTVDGLINNAGIIQPFKPVQDLSTADIDRVLNVNFFGTVHLTRAFLPLLLVRPVAHITNVSSMGGFLPVPGQVLYGAAKAAVKLFTEGLYSELRSTNVGVTVVFPGAIATNIAGNSGLALPTADAGAAKFKTLPAAKAAALILAATEKNQFRATIGPDARFMDWLVRLNPRFATNLIERKMQALRAL